MDYYNDAKQAKKRLQSISPTMCMAKWLQTSIHLPQGLTQSCYHPPTHKVPLSELAVDHTALHNTQEKLFQRKQMWEGNRPSGCQYCWNIEDAPNGPHLSDRHYRSSEWWVQDAWNEVVEGSWDKNINPRYVEVNFNQACNFKCTYCSPHLSTEWEKEIEEHGAFQMPGGHVHNDINSLKNINLMPIDSSARENPYVSAFWKWWPNLYKDLKVFRMTGGEPLMDKNTFKVLDYVNAHPNNSLELSVTSNMCPPDQKLFTKFLDKLKLIETIRIWEDKKKLNPDSGNYWYVAPACKHFTLFVSLDSVGKQAEYIRTGLDFDYMLRNVYKVLDNTHGTEISFINTFNLLSIPKLKDFLQMILDLRIKYGYKNQKEFVEIPPDNNGYKHPPFVRKKRQRIWFDIPYLRHPNWMSTQNASSYPELLEILGDCLEFMEENIEDKNYSKTYHGFQEYEIAKLKRDIAWIKSGIPNLSVNDLKKRKHAFFVYFNQIDKRRKTDFIETFPELGKWWNDCKVAAEENLHE